MDRFITQMANKTVLSPPAAESHKRPADVDLSAEQASPSAKRAKPASDDNCSLPHFPSHSVAWQSAAQSFYDSLPHSHRSPFVSLLNDILDSNSLLLPSSTLPSPLALTSPPAAPQPAAVTFDASTALLTFLDLSFVQPRGKFDVHFTDCALVFVSSGKQPSTILLPFTSLGQLAAVPDVNKKDRCVLLSLRPTAEPLLVGKSKLYQLLLKIDATRQTTDTKALRFPQSTTQPTSTTIADHFIATLRQHCPALPVVTPQADTFKSTAGSPCISCYYGTNDGQLYPLSTGLLFLQRPVVWVALETVDGIEVTRSGGGKTFDVKVGVKRSGEKEQVVVFGMISAMEQQALEWYVQYVGRWQKKRDKEQKTDNPSRNRGTAVTETAAATSSTVRPVEASSDATDQADDSDSEADSDFDPEASSDEEGGGDADRDGNSGSDGDDDSDSDDSQFNSEIDVDAEVSADEEIAKEQHRRTRLARPTRTSHSEPSRQRASRDSRHDSDDEQADESAHDAEQAADGDSTSSSEVEEEAWHDKPKQADEKAGDMSRFRNVATADTSKEQLSSSGSSADERDQDEVIELD